MMEEQAESALTRWISKQVIQFAAELLHAVAAPTQEKGEGIVRGVTLQLGLQRQGQVPRQDAIQRPAPIEAAEGLSDFIVWASGLRALPEVCTWQSRESTAFGNVPGVCIPHCIPFPPGTACS
jgi:hypothetical protein